MKNNKLDAKINKRDLFDIGMVLSIFIAIFFRVYNISFLTKYDFVQDTGNSHFTPLIINLNIQLLVLSCFFLFKICRYKSCIWTKVATISYCTDRFIVCFLVLTKQNALIYNSHVGSAYLIILGGLIVFNLLKRTYRDKLQ